MSSKSKDIDMRQHTYYFFDYIMNLKNFDPNKFDMDEKSYKKILIYYIRYKAIKDCKYLKSIV